MSCLHFWSRYYYLIDQQSVADRESSCTIILQENDKTVGGDSRSSQVSSTQRFLSPAKNLRSVKLIKELSQKFVTYLSEGLVFYFTPEANDFF